MFGPFAVIERIETHHNFAAIERHFGVDVVVHRKGAVRTTDATGEPALVTIPGSMQTGSYIGRGKPSVSAMDTLRARRRAPAWPERDAARARRSRHRGRDAGRGDRARLPPGSDALDEAGRAYKDIEEVMSLQRDLVEPVVRLTPLGVVKG